MGRTSGKEEKIQEFLGAALRVLKRQGMAAVTSYSITEELGVSQPSFFYYFATQASFYKALMDRVVDSNRSVVEALTQANDPASRLQAYAEGNLRWAMLHPEQVDVLVFGMTARGKDSELKRIVRDALAAGESRVRTLIDEGHALHLFQPILPSEDAAYLIHRAMLGGLLAANGLREAAARKEQLEVSRVRVTRLLQSLLRPLTPL